MALTLDADKWRARPGMARLLDALGAGEGLTRLVGGAVRDDLLGLEVNDVDLATRLRPEQVVERLEAANIKAVPTGIDHGTITAVSAGHPVEVTSLRRDVSTDGRRATVAYTDDWQEDAARRDFTINALSADLVNGALFDYFGGLEDLAQRRVRFIGEPLERIAEDHLRILRFLRFHARFGAGDPDRAGLEACAARANDLMALSRERIADELLKMLGLPDPAPTVEIMLDRGILAPVLPEITAEGLRVLGTLVAAEKSAAIPPDPLRRLAALLPGDPALADQIAARLKLSNKARKRLACAASNDVAATPRELAYWSGVECAVDRALLAGRSDDAAQISAWDVPRLPVTGGTLIARGLAKGPVVARTLKRIEQRWVEQGFPAGSEFEAILSEEIARAA
jgi:poly(A) polymerase